MQQERFNIHITLWFESCSHITGILQRPLFTKCKSLFGQGCHHRYIWFLSSPFAVQAVINDLCNEWFPSWDPELPTHKSQGVFPSYVEVFPLKVLDKGCFGERTTWCLASKGIGALSRWPPTLTIPSVRTGCKGRSGLLLDSAQLAWRSLYSCLNNSIWAILHKANKASSRSSTSDQLSPESHHYCG